MIRRSVWLTYCFVAVLAAAQQPKTNSATHAILELPAVLQENVVAGKTPIGTPVHSKLMLATLVNGVVVPQDAVLSGRVEESTAKTGTDPSRLKIHLDVVQWKGGSLPLNAFLTNIYYANRLIETPANEEVPDASNTDPMLTHGGLPRQNGTDLEGRRAAWSRQAAGSHPSDQARSSEDTGWQSSVYRRSMRNVSVLRETNGGTVIVSPRDNIKLDRNTAYCFESR